MRFENENRLVESEAVLSSEYAGDCTNGIEKTKAFSYNNGVSHNEITFENDVAQTDETDETYKHKLTNNDFLHSVFGVQVSDIRPIIVSFKGNPAKVEKSAWSGTAWNPDALTLRWYANNYFSLAAFRPDDSGCYRRRKAHFAGLYSIMLDDIGSKISLNRLTLKPSWLLETSSGNFQAGYLLAEPIQEAGVADRLMTSIVAAGLCDPGANGPTARLARLPEAVNGKHDPAFSCRMHEWNPTLRYGLEGLIEGLQLDVRFSEHSSKQQKAQRNQRHAVCADQLLIPRPIDNAVIATLQERGLYKAPLGGGRHDITCPWLAEHTNAIDGGTAYFEPDDTWPLGGFKCHHGHCATRHISEFLRFLNVEKNAARMKPTIRVQGGEIHRIAAIAEAELAKSKRHYQRGGLIVIICTDPSTRETNVREVNLPTLVAALAGAINWERLDGRSQEWVRIDPPARHCGVLLDAPEYRYLPVLNGIARQPYLRGDGTLGTIAGYDPATGMFGVFSAKDYLIPSQPTKEDAEAALLILLDLLAEFSFARDCDRAATLCAILTAAIRSSLPFAPMFHVRAAQMGSGKSYLCSLIIAFASPQRGAPTTFPQDDEECRKFLLATLLTAPAVIEFDNLTGDLVAHKSLCTTLTSEHLTGRILGVSKTATVSTRALFLSSGNNVGPVQDMARRCLTITLDPACETPATREFKNPSLVPDMLRERGRYVSAALTIIRAWIVAGRPKTQCKALAGYDEWSDLCRQPLLWLGQPDPAEAIFEAMADDPDRDTLGRLLNAWYLCFGHKATMVREAVNCETFSEAGQKLQEVLNDIAGEREGINRRSLGRWIKRHSGRIVGGIRFIRAGGSRSAEAWIVESVS